MIKRFFAWRKRKEVEAEIAYAESLYTLAIASGNSQRAVVLRLIMVKLRKDPRFTGKPERSKKT
jgi:hypothetical protein